MTPRDANARTPDGPTANELAVPDLDGLGDELVARLPTRLALDIFDAVEFTGEFLRDDIDSSGPDEWWRIAALLQLELAADELEGAGAPLVSHGVDGPPPAGPGGFRVLRGAPPRGGPGAAPPPLWGRSTPTRPPPPPSL